MPWTCRLEFWYEELYSALYAPVTTTIYGTSFFPITLQNVLNQLLFARILMLHMNIHANKKQEFHLKQLFFLSESMYKKIISLVLLVNRWHSYMFSPRGSCCILQFFLYRSISWNFWLHFWCSLVDLGYSKPNASEVVWGLFAPDFKEMEP